MKLSKEETLTKEINKLIEEVSKLKEEINNLRNNQNIQIITYPIPNYIYPYQIPTPVIPRFPNYPITTWCNNFPEWQNITVD